MGSFTAEQTRTVEHCARNGEQYKGGTSGNGKLGTLSLDLGELHDIMAIIKQHQMCSRAGVLPSHSILSRLLIYLYNIIVHEPGTSLVGYFLPGHNSSDSSDSYIMKLRQRISGCFDLTQPLKLVKKFFSIENFVAVYMLFWITRNVRWLYFGENIVSWFLHQRCSKTGACIAYWNFPSAYCYLIVFITYRVIFKLNLWISIQKELMY